MISLLLAPQSGAHRRGAYRDSDQLIAFEHLGERNDYVKLIGCTGYTFLSSYFGHLLSLSKKLLYWHCSFSTCDCDCDPLQLKGKGEGWKVKPNSSDVSLGQVLSKSNGIERKSGIHLCFNFKPKCTIFVIGLPKWKFSSNNHHHHQHYALIIIITVGVLTIIKGLGANPITPWCKNSSTQSSLHRNSHLQQPDHQHPCTHRILTIDTTTLQKYQSCCRFSHWESIGTKYECHNLLLCRCMLSRTSSDAKGAIGCYLGTDYESHPLHPCHWPLRVHSWLVTCVSYGKDAKGGLAWAWDVDETCPLLLPIVDLCCAGNILTPTICNSAACCLGSKIHLQHSFS